MRVKGAPVRALQLSRARARPIADRRMFSCFRSHAPIAILATVGPQSSAMNFASWEKERAFQSCSDPALERCEGIAASNAANERSERRRLHRSQEPGTGRAAEPLPSL